MSKPDMRKKIALFDSNEQTRKLLEELFVGMGYQIEIYDQVGHLKDLSQEKNAVDLLVVSLSLLGDSYNQVTDSLAELELGAQGSPPVVGISSLNLSLEAYERLELEGIRRVLSSKAPLMELIFTINRILFPKIRELRRYTRVFGGFPVQFLHQEQWQEGEVYNISREGAFIQTDSPPPESTRLEVRFMLPDQDVPLEAQAVVNWANHSPEASSGLSPRGVGVSFLTLNREDSTSLDRFVAKRVVELAAKRS
jgi:uncharacterized protein (TIGR02266 family)